MDETPARGDSFRRLERATLITSFVVMCAVHGPLIGYKTFANVDEAYASALGERLLEGFKLYDGAVSQRGPLMYYAFEGIAWLHGWDNIVALRVWALAFNLAHLFGVWWMARKLLSREAAVVATALTAYALSFGFPAADAYALHGETLQLPALLAAILSGALAMRHRSAVSRRVRLAGSGLAFGVAASIKQSVLLHPVALAVWLLADARQRRAPLRELAGDVAILVAGTLMVPAAFVIHAARQGTLSQLYYYCVTYNRDVHLRPAPSQTYPWLPNLFFRLTDGTSFFVLTVVVCACAIPILAARARAAWRGRSAWLLVRGFGVRSYLALNFVVALLSAATMYRFFPHYFLQAWPFLALGAGAAAERLARSVRWRPVMWRVTAGFVVFIFFCGWMGTVFGEKADGRVSHDRTVQDLGKLIAATTAPEDRVFVWGFSPWIYQYAHRRPAGRYAFETYVTGMVPWFWEKLSVERARIVPGSVEALLGDLDREDPAVVVDAGSIMLGRPMRAYEPFSAWLHARYCFDLRLGAFDVYRRKPHDGDCALPYFPRPFGAIDWNGHGLPIPLPVLVDEDLTKPLPHGNYFKPIWFKDEPKPRGLAVLHDGRRDKEEAEAAADGFRVEDVEFDWTGE